MQTNAFCAEKCVVVQKTKNQKIQLIGNVDKKKSERFKICIKQTN